MRLEVGSGCFLVPNGGDPVPISAWAERAALLVVLAAPRENHLARTVEHELRYVGLEPGGKTIVRALGRLHEKGLLSVEDDERKIFALRTDVELRGEAGLFQRTIEAKTGQKAGAHLRRLIERANRTLVPLSGGSPAANAAPPDWEAHYAEVRHDLDQPPYMHDQGRVRDLYVELRAAEVDAATAITADGTLDYSLLLTRAVGIHELLDAWQGKAVVVQGNPGAGKSTVGKVHALRAVERGGRGLFVPLLALAPPRDLAPLSAADAFQAHLAEKGVRLPLEGAADVTVVLDGLDEVSIRDQDDQRWTLTLVDFGLRLAREFGMSVVFTGRHEVVQFVGSRVPNLPRFELLPLYVPFSRDLRQADPDALVSANDDLRERWWEGFRAVRGIEAPFPDAFKSGALERLSCEPLMLSMLSAIWLADRDLSRLASRAEVFRTATRMVLSRDYDRMQRHKPLVNTGLLGEYDAGSFHRILGLAAYSAWPNGGRFFALRQVRALCAERGLSRPYELLVQAAESGRPSALLLFYFRPTDLTRRDDGNVEFTHKSFSDYYAVGYLVEALRERAGAGLTFTGWCATFGAAELTSAHLEFFEDAFAALPADEARRVTRALIDLWNVWERVGLSALVVDLTDTDPQVLFNRGQRAARNLATLILLGWPDDPRDQGWPGSAPVLLDLLRSPSSGDGLRRLLKRIRLSETSLEGANLSYTTLDGSVVEGGSFVDAWLTFASLADATLDHCAFERASARSSSWSRATIQRCRFGDAQLSRTDFLEATIRNSSMMGADLREANFTLAKLTNVSFFGADLRGASLAHAELRGVDFDQALADEAMLDESLDAEGTRTTLRDLGWSLVEGLMLGPS